MKVIKYLLTLLAIFFLIIIGFLAFTKTKLTVANAEFHSNYENIFPPNCFIKFENKKFLIKEIYKYQNKILSEYWFVASEGFAVQKFKIPFELNYNNEQKKHRILKYNENNYFVEFESFKYRISEKRKDTLISKINENKIILFINEK